MTTSKSQTSFQNTKSKAPLELNVEFLSAVMKGDYNKAHILCRRILDIEPDNNLCKEFHEVLNEVINKNKNNTDEKDNDSFSSDGDETLSSDSSNSDSSGGSIEENGNSSSESVSENSDSSSDGEDIPIEELKNMSLYVGGLPTNIRKAR